MTRTRASARAQRDLRIERLRLQAGYERLALCRELRGATGALRPRSLLLGLGQHMGGSTLGSAWMLLRRYPFVLSLLSSCWSNPGRRRTILRVGFIAGLVWLGWRQRQEETPQR